MRNSSWFIWSLNKLFFLAIRESFTMCSGKMCGLEPQSEKSSTKKEAVYIWFLIIPRAKIFSTVLNDGLSDTVGFQLLSLRLRNLWHRYENEIFIALNENTNRSHAGL
jgi:hypothetical protein